MRLPVDQLDEIVASVELTLINQWPHVGFGVEAVSHSKHLHAFQQQRRQPVFHCSMHNQPATGRTALLAGTEGAPHDAFDGQLQIRILHDEDGVLATHFQGHPFVMSRGIQGDFSARGR